MTLAAYPTMMRRDRERLGLREYRELGRGAGFLYYEVPDKLATFHRFPRSFA